jgi:diphthamide biosynthesis protein 7
VEILNFNDDFASLLNIACVTTHPDNAAWTVAFAMDGDHLTMARRREKIEPGAEKRKPTHPSHSPIKGIYSGGDDGRLRFAAFSRSEDGLTVPEDIHYDASSKPEGLGGHNAGVTAILPLPLQTLPGKDILVTGSYDDYVRVYAMYDYRPGQVNQRPKVLAELNLGGGVWRLTFLQDYTMDPLSPAVMPALTATKELKDCRNSELFHEYSFQILASCMQAGARILEVKGSQYGEWTIEVLAEFKFGTFNILNYAGDIQPKLPSPDPHSERDEQDFLCVSANFYEKQLCVWSFKNAEKEGGPS